MNISTMKIGEKGKVVTDYQDKNAWYAIVILPNGEEIHLTTDDNLLQVRSTNRRLIVYPVMANSLYITTGEV